MWILHFHCLIFKSIGTVLNCLVITCVFSRTGWTVRGYSLHSRCCEHGAAAKVRKIISSVVCRHTDFHLDFCWLHRMSTAFRNLQVSKCKIKNAKQLTGTVSFYYHFPLCLTHRLLIDIMISAWCRGDCYGSLHLTLSHRSCCREERVTLHWFSGSVPQSAFLP